MQAAASGGRRGQLNRKDLVLSVRHLMVASELRRTRKDHFMSAHRRTEHHAILVGKANQLPILILHWLTSTSESARRAATHLHVAEEDDHFLALEIVKHLLVRIQLSGQEANGVVLVELSDSICYFGVFTLILRLVAITVVFIVHQVAVHGNNLDGPRLEERRPACAYKVDESRCKKRRHGNLIIRLARLMQRNTLDERNVITERALRIELRHGFEHFMAEEIDKLAVLVSEQIKEPQPMLERQHVKLVQLEEAGAPHQMLHEAIDRFHVVLLLQVHVELAYLVLAEDMLDFAEEGAPQPQQNKVKRAVHDLCLDLLAAVGLDDGSLHWPVIRVKSALQHLADNVSQLSGLFELGMLLKQLYDLFHE